MKKREFVGKKVQLKAQSQIITTVLIILLVLAAVVIVWNVIHSTIEKGSEEITVNPLLLRGEMFYSLENEKIHVTVKRTSGKGDIEGVRLIFVDNEGSYNYDNMEEVLDNFDSATYTLDSSEEGKEWSGKDFSEIEEISLHYIYRKNNENTYTNEIASLELKSTGESVSACDSCSGQTPYCVDDVCVECGEDSHCTNQVCKEDTHECVQCGEDNDCPNQVCDENTNVCVNCNEDGDCPLDFSENYCEGLELKERFYDFSCDSDNGVCVDNVVISPSSTNCNDGIECTTDSCSINSCENIDNCAQGYCDSYYERCIECWGDYACSHKNQVCDMSLNLCVDCTDTDVSKCPDDGIGCTESDCNNGVCGQRDTCTDESKFCSFISGSCEFCSLISSCSSYYMYGETACNFDSCEISSGCIWDSNYCYDCSSATCSYYDTETKCNSDRCNKGSCQWDSGANTGNGACMDCSYINSCSSYYSYGFSSFACNDDICGVDDNCVWSGGSCTPGL